MAGDNLARWLRGGHGGVFRHIYLSNAWGDTESRSGAGSTMQYTANLRAELPGLCRDLRKPPFDSPLPLKQIADWVEPFSERYVMLWRLEDLRSHFRNKPVRLL